MLYAEPPRSKAQVWESRSHLLFSVIQLLPWWFVGRQFVGRQFVERQFVVGGGELQYNGCSDLTHLDQVR